MKLGDSMKTVNALLAGSSGDNVLKSERCCGESGTLAVTRPDISTQVRFRKEEEIRKGAAKLRDIPLVAQAGANGSAAADLANRAGNPAGVAPGPVPKAGDGAQPN